MKQTDRVGITPMHFKLIAKSIGTLAEFGLREYLPGSGEYRYIKRSNFGLNHYVYMVMVDVNKMDVTIAAVNQNQPEEYISLQAKTMTTNHVKETIDGIIRHLIDAGII